MLTEIEYKVASLLETCKDQGLGDCGTTQQEAEALSWKLKTVKCNLEKVQIMLQEKYSEDQVGRHEDVRAAVFWEDVAKQRQRRCDPR